MNASQTIFTVFFAISWGITSNVMARWKPFHYALWFANDKTFGYRAVCRTLLSFGIFNVLSLGLFGAVLWLLHTHGNDLPQRGDCSYLEVVVCGGLPGLLIPFGCYHLWLATAHAWPTKLYARTEEEIPNEFRKKPKQERANEPDLEVLGLADKWTNRGVYGNVVPAVLYIGCGLLAALCFG